MTDQDRPGPGAHRTIEIVRDSTFVRFFSDEAILSVVGLEMEVAFLQYGALFVSQTDLGDAERTDAKNVITEVARMRMGRNEFLAMVMDFIRSGILEGRLKSDAIQKSVTEWGNAAMAGSASEAGVG